MELAAQQFGGLHDGPRVLITAGVHGDELTPIEAVRQLAELLGRHVLRGRVTLVPVVNEEAYRLARRTASDERDLARTMPGRPDGSITERVAHALAALIADADAYIDLHAGGQALEVYPLAGYMLHPDPGVLDRQRRMARVFGLPIVWGTDPTLSGRSLSVVRDAKVPAIYAEYLGGAGSEPQGVAAYVRGCRRVLIDLGVIAGAIAPAAHEPLIIEDGRPGSGHLQVQHPAPREGCFRAAVRLGQRVRRGDLLGHVADASGSGVMAVVADHAGIVLVLRVLAAVRAGESLAVVLETDRDPPPGDFC